MGAYHTCLGLQDKIALTFDITVRHLKSGYRQLCLKHIESLEQISIAMARALAMIANAAQQQYIWVIQPVCDRSSSDELNDYRIHLVPGQPLEEDRDQRTVFSMCVLEYIDGNIIYIASLLISIWDIKKKNKKKTMYSDIEPPQI